MFKLHKVISARFHENNLFSLLCAGFDAFGEVLKPAGSQNQTQNPQTDKLLQKDLDSSLASLAGNLNINPAASVKK